MKPFERIEKADLLHIPDIFGVPSVAGPEAWGKIVTPVIKAFGSQYVRRLSLSIVTGSAGSAVVIDSAGPAAPGAPRTDATGVSRTGECWYVIGGYALHNDAVARNLAVGIQKRMPTGTTYQAELFGALGQATSNPLWFTRPFWLDWMSKVYVSTNGALLSGAATETGTITAGQQIGFRYYYIPLQLGEEVPDGL